MNVAPVALFGYRRLEHLKITEESLQSNYLAEQTDLFVFSDAALKEADIPKVEEVRKYIKTITGFKSLTVIERSKHLGLKKSIVSGVSEVLKRFGKVVVIEDDLVSTPNFLSFINRGLDFYQDKPWVFSITGFSPFENIPAHYLYDAVFFPRPSSWGWATWSDRWEKADWEISIFRQLKSIGDLFSLLKKCGEDMAVFLISSAVGKFDSWWVLWVLAHFKNNGMCVFPIVSKIKHAGEDSSGTNSSVVSRWKVALDKEFRESFAFAPELIIDKEISRSLYDRLTIGSFIRYYIAGLLRKLFIKSN